MMATKRTRKMVLSSVTIVGLLLLSFCLQKLAFAQPPQDDSPTLVRKALQAGEIDRETYLLHQMQAFFTPESLPAKFKSLVKPKPTREITFLFKEIRLKWGTFREETRQQLKPLLLRPSYGTTEKTYDTIHFKIHYVTSGNDAPSTTDNNSDGVPDYVESMGTEFENVYSTEITTMGYTAPPGDGTKGGDSRFDVYIKNIGSWWYGYADPEGASSGNSWYSYMVMDNDYSEFPTNTPLENMQVTAAHEFHHAVQFGYNITTADWFMECTSTWIEDEVYDNVNDNWGYIAYFLDYPEKPLDYWGGSYPYGSWIWNRCLSERHGRNIVRNIWDQCITQAALVSISQVLSNKGTDLTEAFCDFSARNYTKGRRYYYNSTIGEPYEEGSAYPDVKIENSASPHNSYLVLTQTKYIDHLASRYYKFVPQTGASSKTLKISFDGPSGKDCGAVVVFETKDGRKIDKRISLNANKDGTAIVSGFGSNVRNYADVNSAILIMNNTTQADDALQFSYSSQYLSGHDPQITPWGWSWGYRGPAWQSPDIWVDTDGDGIKDEPADPATGQEAEPSVGRINKLYAKIRNLGNNDASSVLVKFSYLPAGIGTTDYLDIDSKTVSLAVGNEKEVPVNWDLTNLSEDNGGKWPKQIKDCDHFCVRVTLESTGDINIDNNLAKNNFVNVPVVTSPSPKAVILEFIYANPNDSAASAGLTISPTLTEGWIIEFEGLKEYSNFPLQANEQKLVTMLITPPTISKEEDYKYVEYTSAYLGKRKDLISEQRLDVSGHINGEMVGGMSYNLVLMREEVENPWSLSLHVGAAIPIGDFADDFDPGFNVLLDADYHFTPAWSAVLFFGYNGFTSKITGVNDTYWLNLSANVRYHQPLTPPLSFYVGGGPGLYIPETGSSESGANLGFGIDYEYNTNVTFELGLDYHAIFDAEIQFIHTHAGVIFRF